MYSGSAYLARSWARAFLGRSPPGALASVLRREVRGSKSHLCHARQSTQSQPLLWEVPEASVPLALQRSLISLASFPVSQRRRFEALSRVSEASPRSHLEALSKSCKPERGKPHKECLDDLLSSSDIVRRPAVLVGAVEGGLIG